MKNQLKTVLIFDFETYTDAKNSAPMEQRFIPFQNCL